MPAFNDFLCGLRGPEHSGYESGVVWIERHGGELVSTRQSTVGTTIETWRVRFPDRDLLLTWGLGGVKDTRSGVTFPDEWRVVHDVADKPKRVHPAYEKMVPRTECR